MSIYRSRFESLQQRSVYQRVSIGFENSKESESSKFTNMAVEKFFPEKLLRKIATQIDIITTKLHQASLTNSIGSLNNSNIIPHAQKPLSRIESSIINYNDSVITSSSSIV
jgi:hypothetical protein